MSVFRTSVKNKVQAAKSSSMYVITTPRTPHAVALLGRWTASQPNLLSEDGTTALATASFSRTGEHWAYGLSRSVRVHRGMLRLLTAANYHQGSDFFTIYVRPTSAPLVASPDGTRPSHDEGRLSEEIRYVKFSGITWSPDSKGFFYQVRFRDINATLGCDAVA